MKKTIILGLLIIGILVLIGCVQIQSPEQTQQKEKINEIILTDFEFVKEYWMNGHTSNCKTREHTTDGLILEYMIKLQSQKEEHKKYWYNYIKCKIYEDDQILSYGGEYYSTDLNSNFFPKKQESFPPDLYEFSLGLDFTKNHNLKICCYIKDGEQRSNEICSSKYIPTDCP